MKMRTSMLDVEAAGSLMSGKLVDESVVYPDAVIIHIATKIYLFTPFPKIWNYAKHGNINYVLENEYRIRPEFVVHISARNNRKEDSKKKRLRIDSVPTRNLPKSVVEKKESESAKKRLLERAERHRNRNAETKRSLLPELSECVNQEDVVYIQTEAEVIISSEGNCFTPEDDEFLSNFGSLIDSRQLESWELDHNYNCIKKKVATSDVDIQVNTLFPGESRFLDFITKDVHVTNFTNLASLSEFEKLSSLLERTLVKINYNSTFKLDIADMLFLVLMKLKLNLSFACLSVLFKISPTTVASYFNFMIDLLYQCLPVPWPPQEIVRQTVPYCFKKFKNTRVVVDCSETKVETPSCPSCRVKLYSHYKGGPTLKYGVGISPSGLITYVTVAYGGRATDSFIVRDSGILEKMEYSDAIMTDKGFLIEKDCEDYGVQLIRPPFLRSQKQLTKSQAIENECIASARVHIERAIQRIKSYAILKNTFSWDLVDRVDKILHVVCALVNLQKPIIDAERGQSKKSLLEAQDRFKMVEDIRKQL